MAHLTCISSTRDSVHDQIGRIKAAGIEKGSGEPNKKKVATLTMAQVNEIAKIKLPDMNANDLEAAAQMVAGTARSMGVNVTE